MGASRTTSERPLRRDAQRNRQRLVEAARQTFAERGLDASLEEIAHRAGVSIGTLYNRFPDRYALIDAVLLDRMQESLRIGRDALTAPDAWAGFVSYLEGVCALQARDRGVVDVIARKQPRTPHVEAACEEGFVQARELIERAQRDGHLRADFTVSDLVTLLWAAARVAELTAAVDGNAWRRHLHLAIDGLRADAASPSPAVPMPPGQLEQARLAHGQAS